MEQDLDGLLASLKMQEPDRRLDQVEPQVWQRIAERTAAAGWPRWAGQLQWRLAAVGVALSFGAAFGGAAAARSGEPPEMAVFSIDTMLAPSTILDDRS